MGTDGSYTCSEHSIMYRVSEFLCCTLEIDIALCVNYTQMKNDNGYHYNHKIFIKLITK